MGSEESDRNDQALEVKSYKKIAGGIRNLQPGEEEVEGGYDYYFFSI